MFNKSIAVPWPMVAERRISVGKYRTVVVRTYVLPDGRHVDFELMYAGDIVCVLALTPKKNVVLAKQFRAGPNRVVLDLPGGGCDPGENPGAAAARELREETGYIGDLHHVSSGPLGAYTIGARHVYVATDCRCVGAQNLDENEFIEPVEVPFGEFLRLLRSGQISDATTAFLGLDFLGLL